VPPGRRSSRSRSGDRPPDARAGRGRSPGSLAPERVGAGTARLLRRRHRDRDRLISAALVGFSTGLSGGGLPTCSSRSSVLQAPSRTRPATAIESRKATSSRNSPLPATQARPPSLAGPR
jgi:hypothetical protein